MPKTLATSRIQRTGGGTLTMSRHADGSRNISDGKQNVTLSQKQTDDLISTLTVAASDEWPAGETESVPGVGKVTAQGRGRYDVTFDSGETITLTGREVSRVEAANQQLDKAHRIDTSSGPLDVYADGNRKVGVRHLGDDGKPVDVVFNRGSFAKVTDAVTDIIDGLDFPQPGEEPVRTKTVNTNVGRVSVEVVGDWGKPGSGNRIEITPADGGDWGLVIDGAHHNDWFDATSNILDEAEKVMPSQQVLTEAPHSLSEARQGQASKGRFKVLLIQAGWGSSGYYSEAVLKRDGPKVWPKGTHMYLNHPTPSESAERPEGDVQMWASITTSDPVWDPNERGLVAEIQVFPQWRNLLNEVFAKNVGLSIRASGQVERGTAEGRDGLIVTSLDEGIAVDWVTRAGAGGRVLQLIESARSEGSGLLRKATEAQQPADLQEKRNVGNWLESRIHAMFTQLADDMFGEGRLTRDERIGLSNAIGEGLTAFNNVVAENIPHLYQRDLWDNPEPAPAEVVETSAPIVPAPPVTTLKEVAPVSGGTSAQGSPNGGPIELSEAELRTSLAETKQRLAEAELEIAKLGDQSRQLAEAKTKLAEAERTNLRLVANNAARDKAAEALAESTLPEVAHAKVIESVTGANVPLNEDGALDEAALVKTIKAAIERERDYLSKFAEAAGIGQVRGLGGGSEPHVNLESELGDVFKSLGMNESAASVAAKGRS
jgi:hypothetical protein